MSEPTTILVVEDHDDTRRVLALLLRHYGYAVVEAATVAEGMAKLDGQAVALLDFNLPDGLGTEILDRIRAEGRPIRVAMVSATQPSELERTLGLGADAAFRKPLDM